MHPITTLTPSATADLAAAGLIGDLAEGDEAEALDDAGWAPEQSFSTQFCFAFERPQDGPADGAAGDLRSAARIAGTYTVGYNAASGLLVLSGTLNVDGATYFIDDQLTIDQASSYDAYLSAGAGRAPSNDERRLTAWSVSGMPEQNGSLKLLAGLAVMAHLGLRRHG
ncbi:hypothetical protein HLB44_04980 [Aquincola sp. S2]|uniref:Head decoration protein n=1 Tax=Pseudaquabacterium terrae TaxID=2732868 RepID=A0ABX2EDK7_9BURK|nr:hypothetical protein [Aquabacterium terrae]NRF66332.1 hypothetical protein [Aquabacterium terrae]